MEPKAIGGTRVLRIIDAETPADSPVPRRKDAGGLGFGPGDQVASSVAPWDWLEEARPLNRGRGIFFLYYF